MSHDRTRSPPGPLSASAGTSTEASATTSTGSASVRSVAVASDDLRNLLRGEQAFRRARLLDSSEELLERPLGLGGTARSWCGHPLCLVVVAAVCPTELELCQADVATKDSSACPESGTSSSSSRGTRALTVRLARRRSRRRRRVRCVHGRSCRRPGAPGGSIPRARWCRTRRRRRSALLPRRTRRWRRRTR